MPKFRKKPVVIEAVQFTGANGWEIQDFMEMRLQEEYDLDGDSLGLIIPTLEDGANQQAKHVASPGDWIIKGIKGEFYPCKPDIFAATYEEVE
jgi:hypothetical protein